MVTFFDESIKPLASSSIHSASDFVNKQSTEGFQSNRKRFGNLKKKFSENKKMFTFVPVVIIGIFLIILIGSFFRNMTDKSSVMGAHSTDTSLNKPIAEKTLNKSFAFPILNDEDKEVGKIQYTVEKVALRDEFVINGQKASALEGRAFLILSLKMKNDTENTVSINTRDFVRLKIKGSDEILAPTIHNDPVDVQAISSLPTQLGFPITDDVRSFTLQIGEISGKKETVEVKF